jgi:hypothetical protein
MNIIATGWIYVILMMSITEETVVAGIATFLLYGVFPLTIILYVMRTPQRRQKRQEAEKVLREQNAAKPSPDSESVNSAAEKQEIL